MPAPAQQKILKLLVKLKVRANQLSRESRWRMLGSSNWLRKASGARVLVYHGLVPADHLRYNTLFTRVASFEQQLILYKKYFRILSIDDMYRHNYGSKEMVISLTFDDGFANNYKYVLPLLEKHEVPACFFITAIRDAGYDILWNDVMALARRHGPAEFRTAGGELYVKDREGNYISAATRQPLIEQLRATDFEKKRDVIKSLGPFYKTADEDYWLQMTPGEIARLAQSKWVTIGSHGYFHNDLAKIAGNLQQQELISSKKYLEQLIGRDIKAIAFPYGSYNSEVIAAATNAGYSQLLATELTSPADRNNIMLKERLIVNPFISNINQLHAVVKGTYV